MYSCTADQVQSTDNDKEFHWNFLQLNKRLQLQISYEGSGQNYVDID